MIDFPKFTSQFSNNSDFISQIEERGYFYEWIHYPSLIQIISAQTGISYDYHTILGRPSLVQIGVKNFNEKISEFIGDNTIASDAGFKLKKSIFKDKTIKIENVTRIIPQSEHLIYLNDKTYFLNLKIVCRTLLGAVSMKGPKGVTIDSQNINGVDNFRILIPYSNHDEFAIVISSSVLEDFMTVLKACNINYSKSNINSLSKIFRTEILKAGNNRDLLDLIYFLIPSNVINTLSDNILWRDLKILLGGNLNSVGTDEERAVLNILTSICHVSRLGDYDSLNPKATKILDMIISEKVGNESVFKIMYDRINDFGGDNNFTEFIKQLLAVWQLSTYFNHNFYEIEYDSVDRGVAYIDSFDFNFSEDYRSIEILYRDWESDAPFHPQKRLGTFGIFLTLLLPNNEDLEVAEQERIPEYLPAFYLKGIDDKNRSYNIESGLFLGLDILTAFTGFGPLLQFKRLYALFKTTESILLKGEIIAKVVIGSYEVTSSALSIMLVMSKYDKTIEGQRIRACLFYLDILSLGTHFVASSMLKKTSGRLLDVHGNTPINQFNSELVNLLEQFAGRKASSSIILRNDELYKILEGSLPKKNIVRLINSINGKKIQISKNISANPPHGIGIYQIYYKGKEMIDCNELYLQGLFKKFDEVYSAKGINALKKYLDDILTASIARKNAYWKWISKFDNSFVNHIFGELGVEKILYKDGLVADEFVTIAEGGHVLGPKLQLKFATHTIPDPPIFDLPFKADIEILYQGNWLPKKQTSSMFPEGWTLQRIQEEVAWVYEHTLNMSAAPILIKKNGIQQFEEFAVGGMKIRIEILDQKIINAYPII